MNLKDRLKILHKKKQPVIKNHSPEISTRLDMVFNPRTAFGKQVPPVTLEQLVGGEKLITKHGEVFIKESIENHLCLQEIDIEALIGLQKLFKKGADNYSIEKTLFLDTETTGLSGGTGNYAFLIGAGFFQHDSFVVKQFFLTEYQFEKAMLELLESLLHQYPHIITFNGKSFDAPLLINRAVLCRIDTCLQKAAHTDLLHLARLLWKSKLDSLTFSSIEKGIFRYIRTRDIHGSMIPETYFAFQRHGRTTELKQVFQHNLIDVVNLVRLYIEIAKRFHYPSKYPSTKFAAARCLFDKDRAKAVQLLESILDQQDAPEEIYQAKKLLASHYKSNRQYNQAVRHWKDMISLMPEAESTPFIELAKYYEHVTKDFHKARHMMQLLDSFSFAFDESMNRRKTRIEEKYNKCQMFNLSSSRALSF